MQEFQRWREQSKLGLWKRFLDWKSKSEQSWAFGKTDSRTSKAGGNKQGWTLRTPGLSVLEGKIKAGFVEDRLQDSQCWRGQTSWACGRQTPGFVLDGTRKARLVEDTSGIPALEGKKRVGLVENKLQDFQCWREQISWACGRQTLELLVLEGLMKVGLLLQDFQCQWNQSGLNFRTRGCRSSSDIGNNQSWVVRRQVPGLLVLMGPQTGYLKRHTPELSMLVWSVRSDRLEDRFQDFHSWCSHLQQNYWKTDISPCKSIANQCCASR